LNEGRADVDVDLPAGVRGLTGLWLPDEDVEGVEEDVGWIFIASSCCKLRFICGGRNG